MTVNSNGMGNQFIDLLSLFNLTQHVSFPTQKHGHILDLIITRNNTKAFDVNNVSILLDQLCASDHKGVCQFTEACKPKKDYFIMQAKKFRL